MRLNVASQSSPNFANSYDFGSVGLVNGSLSYLYSSLPLQLPQHSADVDLRRVVTGYRHVAELRTPEQPLSDVTWQGGLRVDRKDTLLYGRLFLPGSKLEALYLRRLSPLRQLKVSCVSDKDIKNGASVLALLQQDYGKYSTEYLFSTDSALLGIRGLYNFGPDPRDKQGPPVSEWPNGRFSAGAELYYGLLNKSGGVSTGLRFTTLPRHTGVPYTMTLTLNPLMGNLSSTYAVKAGPNVALCSQFDFNFYSYESDLRIGLELWRRRQHQDVDWARKLIRAGWTQHGLQPDEDVSGVLKVRWDQAWGLGLLWEGRIAALLFSAGVSMNLQKRDQIFRAVGAELQFSS